MTSQSRKAGLEKLEIVLFASAFLARRAEGGSVFALPPAEPINKVGSDFFKYTPLNCALQHPYHFPAGLI